MTRPRWLMLAGMLLVWIVAAALIALLVRVTAPQQTVIQAVIARALDPAYNPIDPTSEFTPGDVFYLSVRVQDAPPHSTITARWWYEDTLITTEDRDIGSASAAYVLGFWLERVDQPWPEGSYHVEVLLNQERVGVAQFVVVPD